MNIYANKCLPVFPETFLKNHNFFFNCKHLPWADIARKLSGITVWLLKGF